MLILAALSLAAALTTSSVTSASTVALYVVLSGENAGESVPGLICSDFNVLSEE